MSSPKVWWRPPGANDVYTMEASDSGTSCFRFVPFKLNGNFSSIELKGHVVVAEFPEKGAIETDEKHEEISTSRDEHRQAVRNALDLIESGDLEKAAD